MLLYLTKLYIFLKKVIIAEYPQPKATNQTIKALLSFLAVLLHNYFFIFTILLQHIALSQWAFAEYHLDKCLDYKGVRCYYGDEQVYQTWIFLRKLFVVSKLSSKGGHVDLGICQVVIKYPREETKTCMQS